MHAVSLDAGIRLFKEGHYQEAAGVFRQLLGERPDDILAHHHLGRTYFALGDYAGAVKALSEAVRINPVDSESLFWLGRVRLAQRRPQAAISAAQACLDLVPIHPAAPYVLGLAFKTLSRHEEAIATFLPLAEAGLGRALPCLEIGKIYFEMGQLDEARQWAQRARTPPGLRRGATLARQNLRGAKAFGVA